MIAVTITLHTTNIIILLVGAIAAIGIGVAVRNVNDSMLDLIDLYKEQANDAIIAVGKGSVRECFLRMVEQIIILVAAFMLLILPTDWLDGLTKTVAIICAILLVFSVIVLYLSVTSRREKRNVIRIAKDLINGNGNGNGNGGDQQ